MPKNTPNGELLTIEDCEEGMTPVMKCEEIHSKLGQYAVATTHKAITDALEEAQKSSKGQLKHIFVSCWRNLTQWSEGELHRHYEAKNQEWDDFCADVAIFYTTRLVLMDKPIPIFLRPMEWVDEKMNESS